MNELICYFNGKLLPLSEAAVSADDGGLLYGDGIFETMRIYKTRPFQLEAHLKRLQEGAVYLDLPFPGINDLQTAIGDVIRANAVEEGSLRLSLTGGKCRRSLWPRPQQQEPTVLITVRDGIPYPEHLYKQGCNAVTVSFPRNEASPLVRIKSLNYMENMLGKREALQQDCSEGIFLNTKGEITEGTISNLILFNGKTLLTPAASCGLLPGITRSTVLSMVRESLGIPAEERVLYQKDLMQAEEAFLTASIMEIMPLVKVDGQKIGTGKPGVVFKKLQKEYRRLTFLNYG